MGFELVDQAEPYFQLVALLWNKQATVPSFQKQVHAVSDDEGISIYYTAQCPYATGIVEELRKIAEDKDVPFKAFKITTIEEAQRSPTIWTTFGLFYNGEFITHEIISPKQI